MSVLNLDDIAPLSEKNEEKKEKLDEQNIATEEEISELLKVKPPTPRDYKPEVLTSEIPLSEKTKVETFKNISDKSYKNSCVHRRAKSI